MSIAVEATFSKDVRKWLDKIEARTHNLQPVMERASTLMKADTIRHFQEERSSKGDWKPLRPSTKKWKAKRGWTKPLQNTGRLRMSNIPSASKTFAKIANLTPYAGIHQYGTFKVPQREFIWIDKNGMERIGRMVLDYVSEVRL